MLDVVLRDFCGMDVLAIAPINELLNLAAVCVQGIRCGIASTNINIKKLGKDF
jgi:hypothetical protein